MRLTIFVKGKGFYYDVGLRNINGNQKLSKIVWRAGEKQPRFLEDFIEKYGKDKINIISYGSLKKHIKYIREIL